MRNKKIGVFDSGLGGLLILKAIRKRLPQYDYIYFGDTQNLPYGNKTQREIFSLTTKAIEYLIKKDCSLIIIACNSASAKALRKIQRQWLPRYAPHVKVLGVVVPTLEALQIKDFPAGLIATRSTVQSGVYQKELAKLFQKQKLLSKSTPTLVPLIEKGQIEEATTEACNAVSALGPTIKSLILGCTHYPIISPRISKAFPKLHIIDQTKIIPESLSEYLRRHKEIELCLSNKRRVELFFTKNTATNRKLSRQWFK